MIMEGPAVVTIFERYSDIIGVRRGLFALTIIVRLTLSSKKRAEEVGYENHSVIVNNLYLSVAQHSYFSSCSTIAMVSYVTTYPALKPLSLQVSCGLVNRMRSYLPLSKRPVRFRIICDPTRIELDRMTHCIHVGSLTQHYSYASSKFATCHFSAYAELSQSSPLNRDEIGYVCDMDK